VVRKLASCDQGFRKSYQLVLPNALKTKKHIPIVAFRKTVVDDAGSNMLLSLQNNVIDHNFTPRRLKTILFELQSTVFH